MLGVFPTGLDSDRGFIAGVDLVCPLSGMAQTNSFRNFMRCSCSFDQE